MAKSKCVCRLSGVTKAQQEAQSGRLAWMKKALPRGTEVYYLEAGTHGKRVRLFIAPRKGEIQEITAPAGALARIRLSKDGYLMFSGYGYSAGQEAVEQLAYALYGPNGRLALEPRRV